VPPQGLDAWLATAGWEKLVNRQGTTWRRLAGPVQAAVVDAASARALLLTHPSLVRRPVVEWGDDAGITVGFDAQAWALR
jgi:arsenate reductase-like glutaredoxin family protein